MSQTVDHVSIPSDINLQSLFLESITFDCGSVPALDIDFLDCSAAAPEDDAHSVRTAIE